MRIVKFIFNDSMRVSIHLANTIGTPSYGSIIFQRQSLYDHACAVAAQAGIREVQRIENHAQLEALRSQADFDQPDTLYIVLAANAAVAEKSAARDLLRKVIAAGMTCLNSAAEPTLACCAGPESFKKLLTLLARHEPVTIEKLGPEVTILKQSEVFCDISNLEEFNRFFSSDFDVRHFNSMAGGFNTVVKSSRDKGKIKREHDFYYLLPRGMQRWFVQPYDFREDNGTASYSMEKLNIANVGLQWVHNSFTLPQFEHFTGHCFRFIGQRPSRKCQAAQFQGMTRALFLDKVIDRIDSLKAMDKFGRIEKLLAAATPYAGIDAVVAKYRDLFGANYQARHNPDLEVIGHGDLCFSNILYDKSSSVFKLIDPKGAEDEAGLWSHPYYDLAKLSHSVLGLYDFLNHGLFEIVLDEDNSLSLQIISPDLSEFREHFRTELEAAGFDVFLCRLFEASLFFSMLPLHIDYPRKVLAFLLNGIAIMEELEANA